MISPEKVVEVSNVFVGHFVNLIIKIPDGPNFLELLLGFMLSYRKVISALVKLEMLSDDLILKLEKAINTIDGDIDDRLKSLLEQYKEDVNG